MKLIPLSKTGPNKGKYFAMVDDEDYPKLIGFNYHIFPDDNNLYARRHIYNNGKKIGSSYMHYDITGKNGMDHHDKYGLNNQKYNLRDGSASQNAMNKRKAKNCSSKYKGVHLRKQKHKRKDGVIVIYTSWAVGIKKDGVQLFLGQYQNEEEAGWHYDIAALYFFGEFASFNFPERVKSYMDKYKKL